MAGQRPERWHISCIRARCFKSFGADWAEVPLACSTLVGLVGPNGSGKSTLLQCIQFATGASASDLGVRAFKDLCCSTCKDQLCEVEIRISRAGAVGAQQAKDVSRPQARRAHGGNSGSQDHVWVRAALTPDGSRVFSIDKHNKTGLQVKELLRSLGLHLDSTSAVIRQATVTRLADSNTVEAIAEVLSAATGLDRWEEETAKARAELQAARRAMHDINSNVAQLEALISADTARLEKLEHLQRLGDEEVQVAGDLAASYAAEQEACRASLSRSQTELQQAKDVVSEVEAEVRRVEGEECALQQHLVDSRGSAEHASTMLGLVQAVADLQEQAAAASDHLDQAQEGQAHHTRVQAQLCEVQPRAEAAEQALYSAQARLQALQEALEDAEGAAGGGPMTANAAEAQAQHLRGLLASCQSRTQALVNSGKKLQLQLEGKTADLDWAKQEVTKLERQRTSSALAGPGPTVRGDITRQRQALEQRSRTTQEQLSALSVRIRVLQSQLHLGCKGHQPGSTTPAQYASNLSCPAFLHTLFSIRTQSSPAHATNQGKEHASGFRQNQGPQPVAVDTPPNSGCQSSAQRWCRALSVVAGNSLDVVVVGTSDQAAEVLRDPWRALQACGAPQHQQHRGGMVRVWPLDRIVCKDLTDRQRAAQKALGPGRVVLPLDLLNFPPSVHKAMTRAFGGHLLAADSATAAVLANQYGLASVTPDGTVSRRGSVRGGFMGDTGGRQAGGPEGVLLNKVELQEVEAQHKALSEDLRVTRSSLASVDQQQQAVLASEAVQAQVREAEEAVAALEQQVRALQAQLNTHQLQLTDAQQEERRYLELCAAVDLQAQQSDHPAPGVELLRLQRQELDLAAQQVDTHREAAAAGAAELQAVRDQLFLLEAQRDMLMVDSGDAEEGGEEGGEEDDGDDRHGPGGGSGISKKAKGRSSSKRHQAGDAGRRSAAGPGVAAATGSSGDAVGWGLERLERRRKRVADRLQDAQERLESARRLQADAEQCIKEARANIKQLQQKRHELNQSLRQHAGQVKLLEQQTKTHQDALSKVSALGARLRQEYGLRAQPASKVPSGPIPGLEDGGDVAQPEQQDTQARGGGATVPCKDVDSLSKKLKQLASAKQALAGAQALTTAEVIASRARREDVRVFVEHAAALRAAADSLDKGIRSSQQQVMATHRGIGDAICIRFQELCAALIPTYSFTLGPQDTAGADEENQPVILFQRHSTPAPGRGAPPPAGSPEETWDGPPAAAGGWMSTLEQLSGGQRTLVSLALLLAAALEGSSSNVLLLDEVDAALDEANQAVLAQLLSALAQGRLMAKGPRQSVATVPHKRKQSDRTAQPAAALGDKGMQVLCVSHHAAFHKVCDALVQVSRHDQGTRAAVA